MKLWVIISSFMYLPNFIYHLYNGIVAGGRDDPTTPYENKVTNAFWKSAQSLS